MLTATRTRAKNMKKNKKQVKPRGRKRLVMESPLKVKNEILAEPTRFKTKEGLLIEVSVEIVTPEKAKTWLEKYNIDNRDQDKRLIISLANQQINNQWMFNGDPVRFSRKTEKYPDGRLLDGQHRLESIVQSGIAQEVIVIRGLHEDSFATMDAGRKRSGSDILSTDKIEMAKRKAGIVRSVLLFTRGYHGSLKGGGDRSAAPGNNDILEFARDNRLALNRALEASIELKKNFPYLNSKMAGSMFYLFAKSSKKDALAFFDDLKNGKKAEDPNVRLFATKLVSNASKDTKLPYNTILAYFIKTWNAYKEGEKLESLTFNKETEEFPLPR